MKSSREAGIRTPGRVTPSQGFKTGAISRSATSLGLARYRIGTFGSHGLAVKRVVFDWRAADLTVG